jgi:hypothetical protein
MIFPWLVEQVVLFALHQLADVETLLVFDDDYDVFPTYDFLKFGLLFDRSYLTADT